MTKKEEERAERKRKFIDSLKRRQTKDLVEPLAKKIESFIEGKLAPEEIFKTIHHAAAQSEKITKKYRNRPDVVLAEIAMDENKFTADVGDVGVKARLGDITTLFVDAIVNPADPRGVMALDAPGAMTPRGSAGLTIASTKSVMMSPRRALTLISPTSVVNLFSSIAISASTTSGRFRNFFVTFSLWVAT